ncbi:phosphotransferase [Micromonospora yangpuensis]|uniref:phosphotransferase n=1 Tax=Micromonospora yangpuensis TaxID=683228 RepID=UPI000B889E8B|nr:phosphotransferase [Micromonospora yangpuensis]
MSEVPREAGWSDPVWQRAARGWIAEQLARTGRRITGEVEPRVRPWSLVWRVPTGSGPVWFKANSIGTRYEAGLVDALSRLDPDAVLTPLAVRPDRGWLLLPDGGETLRESTERDRPAGEPAQSATDEPAESGAQPAAAGAAPQSVTGEPAGPNGGRAGGHGLGRWEAALTRYAVLQRESGRQVDELVALGVPDHRPQVLPQLFADLLEDRAALLLDSPGGPTAEAYQRLRGYRPEFARVCERLAGIGPPATVQHDDLHDANVFATVDGYRFFDWGDASVGHPFGSLLVTLRSAAYRFGLSAGDPALGRLRDAYLEIWSDRYDRRTLLKAAGLAVTTAKVGRALSWRRALRTDDPARGEYADAVPGWLAELFEPEPL